MHQTSDEKYQVLSREVLLDKIKGAWAVQTIGVTYGDSTEFVYQQRTIPDSVEIEADSAGIMSSGMPNTAAETCHRVGHILYYALIKLMRVLDGEAINRRLEYS